MFAENYKLMKKSVLVVSILVILFVVVGWHKFYLSVSQVDYNPEDKALQITSRLFYDDLQKALQARYDEEIRVDETYPEEKQDLYISKYINKKLKVSVNGGVATLNYLGHGDEDDYVVCYIEITGVDELKSITIKNTLLMDMFTEQKNIVHVRVGNLEKSFMLTHDNDKAVLNISE